MKKRILRATILFFTLLLANGIKAEITLPAIVSSNMVLQRNTTIKIWGWAKPKEKITIKTSWLTESITVECNQNGSWQSRIKTNNSKKQQTINLKSEESDITLDNILFGEVWLCSGQSNMQQSLTSYRGQPTFGSAMAIAKSNNPNLRLFTVDRLRSKTPLKDVKKYTPWQQAKPESTPEFSAIAYFFGQQLQEILDVPVGIIHSSYGGSYVYAWMSDDLIKSFKNISLGEIDFSEKILGRSSSLFNSMINPITQYTIKGVLWYQGEANRMEPKNYKRLFPAMVKDWRKRFDIGDFPFYYVQIAPFIYGNNNEFETPKNSAFMREAQLQCLDLIPNSGIAITMDVGDDYCIHPPKKKEVADRLLFNALNQTYGYKTIDCKGPIFDYMEVKEGGISINFKNDETGLYSYNKLEGFEIAGEDRVFYPASAKAINKWSKPESEVLVTSDKVPNPVAVRYAWKNFINGTLYDNSLLPASSFRTDDWDNATQSKK